MRYGDNNRTFSRGHLADLVIQWESQLSNEIADLSEKRILETDVEELVSHFTAKFTIETLRLDSSDPIFDYTESMQTVEDYGRMVDVPCYECWLDVPFEGNIELLKYRPSSFTVHSVPFETKGPYFRFRQTVRNLDSSDIQRHFDNDIKTTVINLDNCNKQVQNFNSRLRSTVQKLIEARREKVLATCRAVSALPYRIRKRDDSTSAFSAPIKRKKIIPELPPLSQAGQKPEPVLSQAMYKEILNAISRFSLTVERSPSAFLNQDEEAIRFQILAALNTTFETDGTGETFNYDGKTDILLRAEGQNVFIAECKFWRGEQAYLETIDQLLGYLSWRDTKTAVIIFSKNKDFTNVLDVIQKATPKHKNFIDQLAREDETRFDYLFSQVKDSNRRLFLSTLTFNIPTPD